MMTRPAWITSDLVVRLNWLNWSSLGIHGNQIEKIVSIFKMFADAKKSSAAFKDI